MVLKCRFITFLVGVGWAGVVGEVGNKVNTAPVQVGVKVGAELGKNIFENHFINRLFVKAQH